MAPQAQSRVGRQFDGIVLTAHEKHDARWELVERVVASPGFRKSPKISAFLIYVCDLAKRGALEGLNEQQIGIHVFSRSPGYNPSEDNIVRAQARILRWKLEEYFANEGREEPLTISMPKGGYHPEFQVRATAEAAPKVTTQPAVPAVPMIEAPPARRVFSRAVPVLSTLVVVLSAACLWLMATRADARSSARSAAPAGKAFSTLWNGFFGDGERTLIVMPDTTLGLLQLATGPIPLKEMVNGNYQRLAKDLSKKAGFEAVLPGFSKHSMTFTSTATDVALISRLPHSTMSHVEVRSSGDLLPSDLNAGNTILLGAGMGNPWMRLFLPKIDLAVRWDRTEGEEYLVKRNPAPGEQAEFHRSSSGNSSTVFGAVAYVPSLNHRGNVLLVLGESEIAVPFLTNPELSSGFFEKLAAKSGGSRPPHFEALLKGTVIGGQPTSIRVETSRILPDSAFTSTGDEQSFTH